MNLKMNWDEGLHPLAILDKIEKYTRLYRYLSLCHKGKPLLLHRNLSYMRKRYVTKKRISLDNIISKLYLKAWNISLNSNILSSGNEDEIIFLEFDAVQLITTPESINCCHHPQLPKEMTVEIYLTQQPSNFNEPNSVIKDLHQRNNKVRCGEVLLGMANVPIIYEYYNYYDSHPISLETKILDLPPLSSQEKNFNLVEDILRPAFGQKSVITSATSIKVMSSQSPSTKQGDCDKKSSISLKLSDLSPIVKALTCQNSPLSYGEPQGIALKISAVPVIRPKDVDLLNSHHNNPDSGGIEDVKCFIETPPYDACNCYEESLSFALKLRSHVQSLNHERAHQNGDAFNNFFISERSSGLGCTVTSSVTSYASLIHLNQLIADPRVRTGPGVGITCTLMPQSSPRNVAEKEDSGFSSLVEESMGYGSCGVTLKFRLVLSKKPSTLLNGQHTSPPPKYKYEREFLNDIHTTLSQAGPPPHTPPKLENGFLNSYPHRGKSSAKIRDVWIGTNACGGEMKTATSPALQSNGRGTKRNRHPRLSSQSANSEESSSDSGIPLRLLRTKLRKKRLNNLLTVSAKPTHGPDSNRNELKSSAVGDEPKFQNPCNPLLDDASKIFLNNKLTGRKRASLYNGMKQLTQQGQDAKESQKLAWLEAEQLILKRADGPPSSRSSRVRFFLGGRTDPVVTFLGATTPRPAPPLSRDSVPARGGHVCPWCFTPCPQIYALLKHMTNWHFRFHFSLDITEDCFLIDAVPAHTLESTFREEISNFIMLRSISLPKSRKINFTLPRTKRLPHTEIYAVCKFDYLTSQMNLLEFVQPKLAQMQAECGNNSTGRLQFVGSANGTRVKPQTTNSGKEEAGQTTRYKTFHKHLSSCYRKSLTGHNRIYYRSSTYVPLFAQELSYDSESETYPRWLVGKRCSLIDDFTDVDDYEKEFMKLWNRFMMQSNTFLGESHVYQACHTFITLKRQDLKLAKLTKNLIFHLCQLYHFELITATQHRQLWALFNEETPKQTT